MRVEVARDQPQLTDGSQYCARVRARSDRDAGGVDVYGDYTYLNGLAGPGFKYDASLLPAASTCGSPCQLAASDYLLPASGSTTDMTASTSR